MLRKVSSTVYNISLVSACAAAYFGTIVAVYAGVGVYKVGSRILKHA